MKSTSTTLGVGIMAVPERKMQVDRLLSRLALPLSQVVWDEGHEGHVFNWWRAVAVACIPAATHALILEDDAEPCQDFLAAVEKLIANYPERIISFFSVSKTPRDGTSQLSLLPHHGFGDVAVVYPVSLQQKLGKEFTDRDQELAIHPWNVAYGADELRMKLRPHLKMWCTYPSLVQHGSPISSTLGHRFARSLANPCLDANSSALALDWSQL